MARALQRKNLDTGMGGEAQGEEGIVRSGLTLAQASNDKGKISHKGQRSTLLQFSEGILCIHTFVSEL